jgi:tRNA dimethylallyltransferase
MSRAGQLLKTTAGYKEFHNYLAMSHRSDKAFSDAVENMKQSTRKYAKRQVSWLRNKLLPATYAANASAQGTDLVTPTYLLDATGQSTY